MKKLMSILAVALFALGAVSFNSDSADKNTQNQFQNIDQAVATDGGVNKTSGRGDT
ncbi:hypothetical protein U1E44_14770 [Arenibacter sp. GZD96]|uniref:hypothetical protein n=1 Tax=Aurantibrevibacter litoralis TaxID=3106030 RepID=UPI002AFE74DE|nr:hypothetical protein [Arenibacter sp. GZD-96]MEA1787362.1 hypothetical protein [Arenibacter sp. GZD-96]